VLAFALLFLLNACSANEEIEKGISSLESLAENKYEENYQLLYNDNNKFAICLTKSVGETQVPNSPVKFFVYDVRHSEIILEDFIQLGDVEWKSDSLIEVVKYPGTIKKNEENTGQGYLYNVIQREKISN
jgi:ABC-type enterochelin transport system substrate-binding protein